MATNEEPELVDADAAAKQRALAFVGRVLSDRYRIDELMAMGGMGAVYRGEHLRMHKRIAIKVLHAHVEGLPDLVARFEREAIAGAQLSHPNAAAATDFGELEDGSTFLVLEYVAGQTLEQAIERDGPMSAARAVNIAKQLASVLGAAHAAGIVHRDVKPQNVMLVEGTEDFVKLIDFGLAKISADRLTTQADDPRSRRAIGPLTADGMLLGTIAYLAPEAALGMGAVDERADLYALGLILYKMLSGKHPFHAKTPGLLFKAQRFDPPPPISDRAPGIEVPPKLEAIAMKLLAKNRESRYGAGKDVIAALDEAMAIETEVEPEGSVGLPSLGTPTPPGVVGAPAPASPRPSLLRRPPSNATSLTILALCGAAVALALLSRRAPHSSPPSLPHVEAQPSPQSSPGPTTPLVVDAPQTAAPTSQETEARAVSSVAPSGEPPLAASAEGDVRSLRAVLVMSTDAKDWPSAETALLALVQAQSGSLHSPAILKAAKDLASALEQAGNGRADRVFEALSERSGTDGLDVLYDLVESRGGSLAAKRATAALAQPEVLARATPALRIAFELRQAPCDRKLDLLERAESEGDGRTLDVLTTFGPSCFGENRKVEAAVKALTARLSKPKAL